MEFKLPIVISSSVSHLCMKVHFFLACMTEYLITIKAKRINKLIPFKSSRSSLFIPI